MANKQLHITIRVLTPPAQLSLQNMVNEMAAIFQSAAITTSGPIIQYMAPGGPEYTLLNDIELLGCTQAATDIQKKIGQFRTGMAPGHILIYFCRTIYMPDVSRVMKPISGCAAHLVDEPMALISVSQASLYTLAHEVGHVLGLPHSNIQNGLMTNAGTRFISPPPIVSQNEIAILQKSRYLI